MQIDYMGLVSKSECHSYWKLQFVSKNEKKVRYTSNYQNAPIQGALFLKNSKSHPTVEVSCKFSKSLS